MLESRCWLYLFRQLRIITSELFILRIYKMHVLIGQRENLSYYPSSSARENAFTSATLHFPYDILMTRSPEFITHALLGIVFPRISSTLPLCICILSTFPSVLVSTVAVIFGRNGIFICNIHGSVCGGMKNRRLKKMKIEDARKKLQD